MGKCEKKSVGKEESSGEKQKKNRERWEKTEKDREKTGPFKKIIHGRQNIKSITKIYQTL